VVLVFLRRIRPRDPTPSKASDQGARRGSPRRVNAPTIPKIVVRMNPDGSLGQGMMNLATMRAKKPMMIVQIVPLSTSPKHSVEALPCGGSICRFGIAIHDGALHSLCGRLNRLGRLFMAHAYGPERGDEGGSG
jgi:hypothetical protein